MKLVTVLVLFSVLAYCHSIPFNMMDGNMKPLDSNGQWNKEDVINFLKMLTKFQAAMKGSWGNMKEGPWGGSWQDDCKDDLWSDKKGDSFLQAEEHLQDEYEEPVRVETDDQPETEKYTVYKMKAAKWACAEMESENRNCAINKLFKKLFDYINENGIKMTIPVATKVEGNTYTQCFYLPEINQENTPEPDADSGVFIMEKPELKILSLKFESWGFDPHEFIDQKEYLEELVAEEGMHEYNRDFFITAVFTDPSNAWRETKEDVELHSEVWLVCEH